MKSLKHPRRLRSLSLRWLTSGIAEGKPLFDGSSIHTYSDEANMVVEKLAALRTRWGCLWEVARQSGRDEIHNYPWRRSHLAREQHFRRVAGHQQHLQKNSVTQIHLTDRLGYWKGQRHEESGADLWYNLHSKRIFEIQLLSLLMWHSRNYDFQLFLSRLLRQRNGFDLVEMWIQRLDTRLFC